MVRNRRHEFLPVYILAGKNLRIQELETAYMRALLITLCLIAYVALWRYRRRHFIRTLEQSKHIHRLTSAAERKLQG